MPRQKRIFNLEYSKLLYLIIAREKQREKYPNIEPYTVVELHRDFKDDDIYAKTSNALKFLENEEFIKKTRIGKKKFIELPGWDEGLPEFRQYLFLLNEKDCSMFSLFEIRAAYEGTIVLKSFFKSVESPMTKAQDEFIASKGHDPKEVSRNALNSTHNINLYLSSLVAQAIENTSYEL